MPEEERLRLRAIGERVSLVRGWAEEMDEAAIVAEPLTRGAFAMSLLVIGDGPSTRRVHQEGRARNPVTGSPGSAQSHRAWLRNGGTLTSGVLTVSDGAQKAKIHLSGDYPGTTFASDGSGGVIVTDVMPQAPEPPAHSLRPGRRRRSDSVGANG